MCVRSFASAAKAPPQRILELNRGQWSSENRLHWVRDVTFDEDRSQTSLRTTTLNQALQAKKTLTESCPQRQESLTITTARS
jgi:hypothetical protein